MVAQACVDGAARGAPMPLLPALAPRVCPNAASSLVADTLLPRLAEYLAAAPAREAALSEAQAKKYAKLEKMLGRRPKGESDFVEAARRLEEQGEGFEEEAEGSGGSGNEEKAEGSSRTPVAAAAGVKRGAPTEQETGKRLKLDDHEYVEQSREIVQGVRSAVAAGELR